MDFFISTSEQVCPSDRKRTDGHINRTEHAEYQTGRKSRRGHRTEKGPMDTSIEQNTLNIKQEEKADGAIGQKKGRGAHQQNKTR